MSNALNIRAWMSLGSKNLPNGIVLVVSSEDPKRVIDYRTMPLDEVIEVLDANGLLPPDREGSKPPSRKSSE